MLRPVCAMLVFFMLACAAPVPTSGEYTFEEVDTTTDCPPAEDGEDEDAYSEPIAIRVDADEEGFTIFDVPCELDGASFDCVLFDEDADIEGAVFNIYSDIVGKWTTAKKIKGTQTSETSCSGDGCDDLEDGGFSFCTTSVEFEATLNE